MKSYELTVTPDYVSDWGIWEGLREIVQNAIDAETDGYPFQVFFNEDQIIVEQVGVSLPAKTLLLGSSTKKDSTYLGKFGEGYKLALLALVRAGANVEVIQKDKKWTASFNHSEVFETDVLTINEVEWDSADCLVWAISGLSQEDIDEFKFKFLSNRKKRMLMSEEHKGCLYVGGLFVAKYNSLEYGYNFDPGDVPLNRDRNMTMSYSLMYAIAEVMPGFLTPEQILQGCVDQVPDFEALPDMRDTRAILVSTWNKVYPDTVPVECESEIHKLKPGVKYKVVRYGLNRALRAIIDFGSKFMAHKTPRAKLIAWKNKVQVKLTKEELNELLMILEELPDE